MYVANLIFGLLSSLQSKYCWQFEELWITDLPSTFTYSRRHLQSLPFLEGYYTTISEIKKWGDINQKLFKNSNLYLIFLYVSSLVFLVYFLVNLFIEAEKLRQFSVFSKHSKL